MRSTVWLGLRKSAIVVSLGPQTRPRKCRPVQNEDILELNKSIEHLEATADLGFFFHPIKVADAAVVASKPRPRPPIAGAVLGRITGCAGPSISVRKSIRLTREPAADADRPQ